ncbi:DMT family transporter [Cryobacterium sp. SO1]|uniref:DMT family transporter n=1 Tax=Cryobacterium sp. SO1 TaxID=1897061 RepID=UPI00102347E4|nr:DMT family transporter [Cryobacterium sp. SO1]RZI36388.1 putative cystine transporter YijE [Cryobacterium sp. SO1]
MEATSKWMLVTAVAPIAWGTTYFVTREFLPPEYPLHGAVIRALPAGILLLLVARARPRGAWWWKAAVLGALNVGLFFVLLYVTAQLLPSSLASTVMAVSPVALMMLAWPLLGERPRMRAIVGALAGIAGVSLMLLTSAGAVNPLGVLASVAAMSSSAVGFVLTKRWAPTTGLVALTSWQLIAGGLFVLPVALLVEGAPPLLTGTELAGFAYVSVVATAVAFTAWFAGLRHLRASSVGLIGLLNPVSGVLLGVVAGGEVLGGRQVAGLALVVAGMLVGQRGAPRLARWVADRRVRRLAG